MMGQGADLAFGGSGLWALVALGRNELVPALQRATKDLQRQQQRRRVGVPAPPAQQHSRQRGAHSNIIGQMNILDGHRSSRSGSGLSDPANEQVQAQRIQQCSLLTTAWDVMKQNGGSESADRVVDAASINGAPADWFSAYRITVSKHVLRPTV